MRRVIQEDGSLKNILLVVFNTPSNLNSMNVFEVGTNKPYFNHGKTKHHLSNEIVPAIEKAVKFLTPLAKKQNINILLCGRTLDWLNSHSKETLNTLKTFLRLPKVKLLTSTYYNSNPLSLQPEEFEFQLKSHINILKSTLGKKSTTLVTTNPLNKEQNKISQKLGIRNSITVDKFNTGEITYSDKLQINILTTDYFLEDNQISSNLNTKSINFSKIDKTLLSKIDWDEMIKKRSKLHNHIHEELLSFYPIIKKLNDKNHLEDWRMLNSAVDLESKNKYDNYMNVMNTLNDISFKIKNIHLLKSGKEIIKPNIVNNPSEILKSILN